jgi:hypothetical protein
MKTQRFQQVAWMALLGLVVSGLVWSTPALAAQTKAHRMSACTADEQQFCPDAKTATERTQCLKDHEADLSQGCKDLRARAVNAGAKQQAKMATMKEVCKSDAETLCKNVKPGRGSSALTQCLQSHEADPSMACKDTLPKSKKKTT